MGGGGVDVSRWSSFLKLFARFKVLVLSIDSKKNRDITQISKTCSLNIQQSCLLATKARTPVWPPWCKVVHIYLNIPIYTVLFSATVYSTLIQREHVLSSCVQTWVRSHERKMYTVYTVYTGCIVMLYDI